VRKLLSTINYKYKKTPYKRLRNLYRLKIALYLYKGVSALKALGTLGINSIRI